jgi:hypothetical protein
MTKYGIMLSVNPSLLKIAPFSNVYVYSAGLGGNKIINGEYLGIQCQTVMASLKV